MSSVVFRCRFTLIDNAKAKTLAEALKLHQQEYSEKASQMLTGIGADAERFLVVPDEDLEVTISESAASIYMNVGSAVPIDYYEHFMALLDSLNVTQYKANVFDTSSGGCQFWEMPEPEPVELDGKCVYIHVEGDMDVDEIEEMLEDFDVEIQQELTEDTEVIVVADDCEAPPENTFGAVLITEDRLWQMSAEGGCG